MEVIVTMCWSIWSVRNDAIFNGVPPSVQRCKLIFMKEFALGPVWLSCGCGKKLLWAVSCGKAAVGCEL